MRKQVHFYKLRTRLMLFLQSLSLATLTKIEKYKHTRNVKIPKRHRFVCKSPSFLLQQRQAECSWWGDRWRQQLLSDGVLVRVTVVAPTSCAFVSRFFVTLSTRHHHYNTTDTKVSLNLQFSFPLFFLILG